MRRSTLRLAPALAALSLGACSLVVDDQVGDLDIDPLSQRNVTVSLRAFEPHIGQLVDVRVVDPTNDFLNARAIIDPLPAPDVDIRLLNGAPIAVDRIDFYADLNMNRMLDPAPDDHVWRCDGTAATPCMLDEAGRLLFVHNVMFQDITEMEAEPVGADLVLNVTGADEHDGQPVLARIRTRILVDVENDVRVEVVPGLYRLGNIEAGTVAFTLPGIADRGQTYDLELIFGDDALECVLPALRAPDAAGEDFLVERPLSDFECAPPEPVDCAALEDDCEMDVDGACNQLADRCAFVDRSR